MNITVMTYLVLFRHSGEWSHLVPHLLKICLGIAAILAIFVLVNGLAGRGATSGKRKHRFAGSLNRQQRRQERHIKRKQ